MIKKQRRIVALYPKHSFLMDNYRRVVQFYLSFSASVWEQNKCTWKDCLPRKWPIFLVKLYVASRGKMNCFLLWICKEAQDCSSLHKVMLMQYVHSRDGPHEAHTFGWWFPLETLTLELESLCDASNYLEAAVLKNHIT